MTVAPLRERIGDFAAFLAAAEEDEAAVRALRQSCSTGRPVGASEWVAALEAEIGRVLAPGRRGPKPRLVDEAGQAELFSKLSPQLHTYMITRPSIYDAR